MIDKLSSMGKAKKVMLVFVPLRSMPRPANSQFRRIYAVYAEVCNKKYIIF